MSCGGFTLIFRIYFPYFAGCVFMVGNKFPIFGYNDVRAEIVMTYTYPSLLLDAKSFTIKYQR